MDQLRQDLSYAARIAFRHREFTAAAVLTVALGIGAATATFSLVDAIVLRPLPYADTDRLVKIWGGSAAVALKRSTRISAGPMGTPSASAAREV